MVPSDRTCWPIGLTVTGEDPTPDVGHRLVKAGHSVLFASGLKPGAGAAQRATWTCTASWARDNSRHCYLETWATCPRATRSPGPGHPHRRTTTNAGPWAFKPGFSEWERHLCQPHGHRRGDSGSCTTPSSWSLTSISYRTNAGSGNGAIHGGLRHVLANRQIKLTRDTRQRRISCPSPSVTMGQSNVLASTGFIAAPGPPG